MASHESYYTNPTSATPTPLPPQHPQSPLQGAAPPPPPPKSSYDSSRTAPPIIPSSATRPTSSSPVPPPPVPKSPIPDLSQQQPRPQPPPSVQSHRQQQFQPISPPPLDSGWLPDGLFQKSTAELQPLLNNPELLTALAQQHPSYTSSLEPLQIAIASNLSLAQQVGRLESQVKQLRDQTGQLLLNHTSLQTQWRRKQSEMDDALSPWGPRAMYQRLGSSISEQESLLRAVHESFLEGSGSDQEYHAGGDGKATEKEVTDWMKRIREGTIVLEKRREMRARWDEGRVGGWR